MVCPHGDRCALGADEPHPQGGHNMRVCPCNEGLRTWIGCRRDDRADREGAGVMPCESAFYAMPAAELIALISSTSLAPEDLTFAAESAGQHAEAVPALLTLLDHEQAVVREGALYGLTPHVDVQNVAEKLREVARHDSSGAVRVVAASIVDEVSPSARGL